MQETDYNNIANYEPSLAMVDPTTGNTYWRVKSKDGKVNYITTEKDALRKNRNEIIQRLSVFSIFIFLAAYVWDNNGHLSQFFSIIIGIVALVMPWIEAERIGFDFRFIAAMKRNETEMNRDIHAREAMEAARRPIMPERQQPHLHPTTTPHTDETGRMS